MPDRRQRKTRSALQNALMRLMLDKDIAKITVKDVAELADINRSTFYLHYYDVYDILTDIEREAVNGIAELVCEMDFDSLIRDPYPLLRAISDKLTADPLFTRFLLKSGNTNFYSKIQSELAGRLTKLYASLHADVSAEDVSVTVTFVTAGVFSVYAAWFASDRKIPLESVCKSLSLLITDGVRAKLPDDDSKDNVHA